MTRYHHFAAIFTTTLIREEFKKVIVDPVKFEFFKGSARSFSIPAVSGRIFPVDMESTLLMTPVTLAVNPNSYYIAVIARSDEPKVRVALKHCEDAVDRGITGLALLFKPYIFDRLVYRGPVIEGNAMSAGFYARRENPVALDPAKLKIDLETMQNLHSAFEGDLRQRYSLMARFFSKAVALEPSEEKFLFLWTVFEVFPMKDTSNVRPLKEFLSEILGHSVEEIDKKLLIGRTYGLRSDLVHDGKLDLTPEELGKLVERVENICLVVLRSISGHSHSGLLDQYFA